MFWARLAGGTIALFYAALFLWTLKRRKAEHFLGFNGMLRLLATAAGLFVGLALAWRPPLAGPMVLLWVFLSMISSWADYFRERRARRQRR